MAPIKPTTLPPAPGTTGRPQIPAAARPGDAFPAPASQRPDGPKAPAAREPASPAAGRIASSGEGHQLFTLQTLSTFAGLVVGSTDAAPPARGPAAAAVPAASETNDPSPVRPLRPGSQIDIKV